MARRRRDTRHAARRGAATRCDAAQRSTWQRALNLGHDWSSDRGGSIAGYTPPRHAREHARERLCIELYACVRARCAYYCRTPRETRPPFRFEKHEAAEGRERSALRRRAWPMSPSWSLHRHSLPPIYTTFFRPLSLSLSFCSPSKSAPFAPLQPSSARSRVRESCISIFFRWSKRGPFGSCSRIPHCLPLSRLFLSLSLFPSPVSFFLRARGPRRTTDEPPSENTYVVPDSFRTIVCILAFLLHPCSLILSLSLSLPSLLLPSSSPLCTPPRYIAYEALDAYTSLPCISDASSLLQPPLRYYFARQ